MTLVGPRPRVGLLYSFCQKYSIGIQRVASCDYILLTRLCSFPGCDLGAQSQPYIVGAAPSLYNRVVLT